MTRRRRAPTRPVGRCPSCERVIACTFDSRTGQPYLRPHVVVPGEPCPLGGKRPRNGLTVLPGWERDLP